jgi:hypothetical protein
MQKTNFQDNLQLWLTKNQRAISVVYVTTVLLMMFTYLLGLSIRMTDTDMWYHLTGGRFLFETGNPANPTDISFLPARDNLNYFWGFQAIVFAIWSVFDYFGLIVMKSFLMLGTAWFLVKIIAADSKISMLGLWQLLLLSLIVYLLSSRGVAVWPHLFSYLFISFFIYTLMYREKWFAVLPLLTIL